MQLNTANSEITTGHKVSRKLAASQNALFVFAPTQQVLNVNCGRYFVYTIAGLFFS
jgi:hypothetical protein